MKPSQYASPSVFSDYNLLQEASAVSLVEKEDLHTITITSNIPSEGPEFQPVFKVRYDISLGYSDVIANYSCMLMEKKVSGSVEKPMYQLLTFKVVCPAHLTKEDNLKMQLQLTDRMMLESQLKLESKVKNISPCNDYDSKRMIRTLRGMTITKEFFDTIALRWSHDKEVMDAARLAARHALKEV